MMDGLHALETRLDAQAHEIRRLRRRQAWLSMVGFVATGALVVAFTRPAGDTPDEIKAHRFTLVDKNGRESATWTTLEAKDGKLGEAYLVFTADQGMRLMLSGGEAPTLMMNGGGDLQKDGRLGHAVLSVGASDGPSLKLWGQNEDAYTKGAANTARSVEYRGPWGDSADCIVLKKNDDVQWKAP